MLFTYYTLNQNNHAAVLVLVELVLYLDTLQPPTSCKENPMFAHTCSSYPPIPFWRSDDIYSILLHLPRDSNG